MTLSTSERVALQRGGGVEGTAPSGWMGLESVPAGVDPAVGATGRARARGRGVRNAALGLVLPLTLVTVWHVLSVNGVVESSRLPPPADVGTAFVELVQSGRLWPNLAVSLQRVFLGFGVGAALAVVVGIAVALVPLVDRLVSPLLSAVRAVPSLAWVPLLVLWYGIGEESKVVLVAIGAFFPVLATLTAGIRQVDVGLLEVARAYGLSWPQRVRTVLLPSAAPSLLAGVRLGLNQAWLFLVAAELLGAAEGLGWLLQNTQRNGQIDLLLVTIILFALLGKASDALVAEVERRVLLRLR